MNSHLEIWIKLPSLFLRLIFILFWLETCFNGNLLSLIVLLFDICLLISSHVVNTIGYISTFDLIQLLIQEHYNNRVGVTFLSKTAHQIFTNDDDGYIPPEQTFGKWWELLSIYKYGITFNIANKVISYINKYNKHFQGSINIMQNEEIMRFAWANEYGEEVNNIGLAIPMQINQEGVYYYDWYSN